MTFHYLFLYLLTARYLGVYYVPRIRAGEKQLIRALFFQVIWWLPFLLLAFSPFLLAGAAVITAAQTGLLYLQAKLPPVKTFNATRRRFFLSETVMLLVILFTAYTLTVTGHELKMLPYVTTFFTTIGVSFETFLTWVGGLILIDKPANETVVHIIRPYAPRPQQAKKLLIQTATAGKLVGTMERLIMFVLFSIHSVSTIAFVLTAKSIARYDRISKDQDFAEYYLLGTLLSTGIVIIISAWLLG